MRKATIHTNKQGDVWMNVPNTGLFPMLLLEFMSEGDNFDLVGNLIQRAYDEDAYGIDKYTQVDFWTPIDPVRVAEICSWLNLNAGE